MRTTFHVAAVAVIATMAPVALAAQGNGARYANPILFADYSDPDVIRVGEDFYLVSSSFHLSPGIPVLHSRDLVHWRIIGHVLPRLPFGPLYDMPGPHTLNDSISKPIGGTKYASGVWAPSIRHHEGRFYVYWATPDEGVFMASAADPAGLWTAPVQVIAQAGLEDPCPFWDDDGTAWLVHSRVGAGPLVLHRMSPDGKRVLDAGKTIVEDKANLPVLEGPKVYKRDGWYYIWAPIGGVSTGPQAVMRARSIEGPYEHRVVLKPGGSLDLAGPHQGGWVETADGKGWFVHFNSTGAFGRIAHLQPVRWGADGWPIVGEAAAGETAGMPVVGGPMPAPAVPARIQAGDEFAGRTLGLQWQWNHNPDNAAWSLAERPGYMRLRAGHAEHLVTARNTLTQMLQGPTMRVTARIDVSAMRDGQRGGLALFGVKPSWIGVVQEGGKRRVTLASEGTETPAVPLPGKTIDLRAEVGIEQQVRYSYSLDGGRRFLPLGDPIPLAKFSWWRGSRPALFSFTRAKAGKSGWIDADWFRVEVMEARP